MIQSDNINFDESDKNLFQIDDPQLRADALRYSILPRLNLVINDCVSQINRIYGINVLEDSTVEHSPHFRLNERKNEVRLFEYAGVGFNGKRKKGKWRGLKRKDGKPVTILRCGYGLQLTKEGGQLYFIISGRDYYTDESQKLFFNFLIEQETTIHMLCDITGIRQDIMWQALGNRPEISTYKDYYDYMINIGRFDISFASEIFPYPISKESLFSTSYSTLIYLPDITTRLVWFYPVFDSYLQLAKGEKNRFNDLICKLKNEVSRVVEEEPISHPETVETFPMSEEEKINLKTIAETRVKVMPALRWQVFQRDKWKCVSCGRNPEDGIILHVDHIVPRSKGGKDRLENYQTLCHLCNIGKSNRDSTDLRAKKVC